MKNLISFFILIFLTACQQSELERCLLVNTEPTLTNNFIIKNNLFLERNDAISKDINIDNYGKAYSESSAIFFNSLNPLELIVNQCVLDILDMGFYEEGMTQTEYTNRYKQNAESCMLSTANEVKELQLKIEAENREKAQSVCNAQGIY